MSTNNEDKEKDLDLLVIGSSHEIIYSDLVKDLPHLHSRYLHMEHASLKELFTTLNPRMTLIYGELSKGSGKSSEANLQIIESLLKLKKPEQKILIAAYFEFSSALKHLKVYHLRLPSPSKNILRKFEEMK